MKINKTIVTGLIGLSAICYSAKAENMPDKDVVRYVGVVQKYLQKSGYETSICGINPIGKDFLIGIDYTLRGNDTLEPKLILYPMKENLPTKKWMLLYDRANEEDFKAIDCNLGSSMSYAMLGTENGIRKTLDRYFGRVLTTQAEPKENVSLPKKADLSSGVYDLKGRAVKTLDYKISEDRKSVTVAAGTYFTRMNTDRKQYARKIGIF